MTMLTIRAASTPSRRPVSRPLVNEPKSTVILVSVGRRHRGGPIGVSRMVARLVRVRSSALESPRQGGLTGDPDGTRSAGVRSRGVTVLQDARRCTLGT